MKSSKLLNVEELHPDIKNQPEFEKKVAEILARRRKQREEARDPKKQRERRAIDFYAKSKIIEEKDHEYSMARSELHKIESALKTLRAKLKGEGNIEAWVQSKITRAADYLDAASNYLDSGEHNNIEESHNEDDIPEMRSRTVTDGLTSKLSDKSKRLSPGELMRNLNKTQSKDDKKLKEETMTPEQKEKEKRLKKKYDESEMKQNMIDEYGEEKGTQIYFAKIRKMAMEELQEVEEYLEEKKLSRTTKRAARAGKPGYDAEGKPKPKGKVRAWDMDETLMRNDPKKIRVHVKDKEGKTVQSLTNQEFNTHKLDKDKGHSYDFSEFRSSEKFSKASTPNKSMIKKLKKQVRRGKPVHIVTARGSFDDQPKFAKHLRKHGIEIDPGKAKGGRHVHVHRAGDMPGSDIGKKKVDIVKGLMKKHGTSGAEMYDDAAKVHKAFKSSAKETPTQPKVKTKMVQPNKKGVTQARSFKDDIDFDLLYDFLLEQLILEDIAEDYDDASMIIDKLDDELLEEFINESYEFIYSVLEEEIQMEEEVTPKIDYVSPYKKLQEKREIKDRYINESVDLTPYEFWKSFIGEAENIEETITESTEELMEDLVEEVELTSYQKWKKLLENS